MNKFLRFLGISISILIINCDPHLGKNKNSKNTGLDSNKSKYINQNIKMKITQEQVAQGNKTGLVNKKKPEEQVTQEQVAQEQVTQEQVAQEPAKKERLKQTLREVLQNSPSKELKLDEVYPIEDKQIYNTPPFSLLQDSINLLKKALMNRTIYRYANYNEGSTEWRVDKFKVYTEEEVDNFVKYLIDTDKMHYFFNKIKITTEGKNNFIEFEKSLKADNKSPINQVDYNLDIKILEDEFLYEIRRACDIGYHFGMYHNVTRAKDDAIRPLMYYSRIKIYINMGKYKLKREDQGYLYSSHYKGYTEAEGKRTNKIDEEDKQNDEGSRVDFRI
ncbi:hypothetical protein [Borrelia hermsii]|uniref:Uncharacterized protein n=1 Tax=Borrelia hermsii MTW TaxID=1313291 RepID=W5T6B1_BORHE|nr:hypothetical protein [Borrelia hermsii]AHH14704.1 hypothetical protein BHW_0029800 [Borrelia hermsii MTW]